MIYKITLENFFSFGEKQEFVLNKEVNILLGINGSGKSNFMKAIRLLSESITGKGFQSLFLKEWGGFLSVCFSGITREDSIKISYEFDRNVLGSILEGKGYKFRANPIYEIKISKAGSTGYFLSEKIYNITAEQPENPFVYLEMENGKGCISTKQENGRDNLQFYPSNEEEISFKTEEFILRQISDPNRHYPLFTLKNAIEQMFVYDYFDTTPTSKIRNLSEYNLSKQLLPNGENLVNILHRMKNHEGLDFENIEKVLKSINPMFKDISFDISSNAKLLLVLREEYLSKAIPADHISDGTLRFLLLLSILHNPERGALVCIDEPEIGLHPDMTNMLAEAFKQAARKGTLFIIATHSPLFLNSFEVDDLWVLEKGSGNQTIVYNTSEEEIEEWAGQFSTGQLYLSGKLKGVRWQ
ncbi:MAG: putative ATPase [Flammeovirgaceae bacterium]|jgi:predicted ATPase